MQHAAAMISAPGMLEVVAGYQGIENFVRELRGENPLQAFAEFLTRNRARGALVRIIGDSEHAAGKVVAI
jgi:hypothetical protein